MVKAAGATWARWAAPAAAVELQLPARARLQRASGAPALSPCIIWPRPQQFFPSIGQARRVCPVSVVAAAASIAAADRDFPDPASAIQIARRPAAADAAAATSTAFTSKTAAAAAALSVAVLRRGSAANLPLTLIPHNIRTAARSAAPTVRWPASTSAIRVDSRALQAAVATRNVVGRPGVVRNWNGPRARPSRRIGVHLRGRRARRWREQSSSWIRVAT